MGSVICHVSISLDGFLAGPDQSMEQPLGVGGERAARVALPAAEPRGRPGRAGGHVPAGRGVSWAATCRPVRGPWTGDWRGWWGEEPPYHAPVFVLTHHEREPVEMAGGRRSPSSPRASTSPWSGRGPSPATATSGSRAAPRPCARRCWRGRRGAVARHRVGALGSGERIFDGARSGAGAGRGRRLPDGHPRPVPRRRLRAGEGRHVPWSACPSPRR